MKKYILPLLMHVMSCGVDESKPPVVLDHPVAATTPVHDLGPVPDLQNPPLHPVFPGFEEEDRSMVRSLNPYERRQAEAIIGQARFLVPYAVQLADNSVLAGLQSK